jgi:hypothetical protein
VPSVFHGFQSIIKESALNNKAIVFFLAVLCLAACEKTEKITPALQPAHVVQAPEPKYVTPADALPMSIDSIKGQWNVGDKVAKFEMEADGLICINEKGDRSKTQLIDGKAVLATDWRVHAWLLADGKVLRWSDGSGWTR